MDKDKAQKAASAAKTRNAKLRQGRRAKLRQKRGSQNKQENEKESRQWKMKQLAEEKMMDSAARAAARRGKMEAIGNIWPPPRLYSSWYEILRISPSRRRAADSAFSSCRISTCCSISRTLNSCEPSLE